MAKIDTRPLAIFAMILTLFGVLWGVSQPKAHAVTIELPFSWNSVPDLPSPPYVTVEIDALGDVYADGEPVSLERLGATVLSKLPEWPIVLLRPSAETSYEDVAKAINALRSAGVSPDDVCLDPLQLGTHRSFDKMMFQPIDETNHWMLATTVPPRFSGCEQFYPPIPSTSHTHPPAVDRSA